MKISKRLQIIAVAATALVGTMALAAPVSATHSYYSGSNTYSSYSGYSAYYNYLLQLLRSRQTVTPTTTTSTAPTTTTRTTTTTAPTTTTTTSTAGLTAAEQQMLNLVNQERSKNGLRPLQADLQVTKVARLKSQDMIRNNYFSHNSPTYGSPFEMLKSFGISYRTAGENLAGNSSVSGAHTSLMNSSGHRANILGSGYTHVGIGIVDGGQYGKMFTQLFIAR